MFPEIVILEDTGRTLIPDLEVVVGTVTGVGTEVERGNGIAMVIVVIDAIPAAPEAVIDLDSIPEISTNLIPVPKERGLVPVPAIAVVVEVLAVMKLQVGVAPGPRAGV